MGQLMKFRLLPGTGKHYHKGNVYKAGDIVESDKDLVQTCENKFERVYEAPAQEFTAPNVARDEQADSAPKAEAKKK